MEQKTYIMIKPDAVARGLVGKIVSRFEEVGLKIERIEFGMVTAEQAAANYVEHRASRSTTGSSPTSRPVRS